MVIEQGDVYWLDLGDPSGSGPGFRRPVVVVQNDVFNQSRIATVVVCILTSNVARAGAPGNVALARGEAGLSKASVANVTQVFTVDKTRLQDRVGSLPRARICQILHGIRLVLEPREL